MPKVAIKCNRCNRESDGYETDVGTAGFYKLTGYWTQFKRSEKEEVICDECMWVDPKYIEMYPRMLFKEKDEK